MKWLVVLAVALGLMVVAITTIAQNVSEENSKVSNEESALQGKDQIVVYYLHMNRRCMTCGKLEAYSQEAIEAGFAEQLKDSSLVFKVENFEVAGNEHFAKDYGLFSQSLILSRQRDGKETAWKNLDKIWELVSDKEAFVGYVQSEVTEFMHPDQEK